MEPVNGKQKIRKRRYRLCIGDKLKILQHLENCEKQADIAKSYNVTAETISRINRTREQILNFSKMHGTVDSIVMNSKKTIKLSGNTPLEQNLYQWFMAKKEAGIAITGMEIKEEALRINRNLGGSPDFKASNGWLSGFKRRHGIKQMHLPGVGLGSINSESAKNFCDEVEKIILENNYKPANIYNVIKNGLQWNGIPQNVENVGSLRILKDRVPLVLGVNSDGSHRLPVLVSGRVQNPRSFGDEEIPVKYVFHGNGYPGDLLISQWFSEVFVPEIKHCRKEDESQEKILLVTDTTPTLSMMRHAEQFNVKIVVIPMEAMSVPQPLYQGIFEKFKKRYKEIFMNEMVVEENGKKYALDKKWTIRDCCFTIARVWDSFTSEDFQMSWRKLLKIDELDDRNNEVTFYSCGVTEELVEEKQDELYQTIGEISSSSSDVQSSVDSGHTHLKMEDSFENGLEFKTVSPFIIVPENPNTESETNQLDIDEKNLRIEMEKLSKRPSKNDALNAVTTLFGWANYQGNATRQDIWDIVKLRSMILSRTS